MMGFIDIYKSTQHFIPKSNLISRAVATAVALASLTRRYKWLALHGRFVAASASSMVNPPLTTYNIKGDVKVRGAHLEKWYEMIPAEKAVFYQIKPLTIHTALSIVPCDGGAVCPSMVVSLFVVKWVQCGDVSFSHVMVNHTNKFTLALRRWQRAMQWNEL